MTRVEISVGLSRREAMIAGLGLAAGARPALALEQRDEVDFLRGPYNEAFFYRHPYSYRVGAAMHFFHSKEHDLLLQTPFAEHARYDRLMNDQSLFHLRNLPRTEPKMDYYSEYADRALHLVLLAIDWTHQHHEQTYDILSAQDIAWADKQRWTDRAVRYYLTMEKPLLARSCAPLDVTLRRAGLMMKPYNTLFRNYYPLSNNLFFVAHWWHPAIYESLMIAGEGEAAQHDSVAATNATMWRDFMPVPLRPQRMMLSREIMPRYSRMSAESANIFDNLHMLHGITYDICCYPHWTIGEKRAELYRVIHAMAYHPGDERYARKFALTDPGIDPRVAAPWIRSPEGAMSRIMGEMLEEMMPLMMPGASPGMMAEARAILKMKSTPGIEAGEAPGSLGDALMAAMPGMRMMPGAVEPGVAPDMMVAAMLRGWAEKHGGMADVPGIDMSRAPVLPPVGQA